jgi:hypothetical protein
MPILIGLPFDAGVVPVLPPDDVAVVLEPTDGTVGAAVPELDFAELPQAVAAKTIADAAPTVAR